MAELLLLLSADNPNDSNWLNVSPIPGKLFFVGDPKQSIYRFRRPDSDLPASEADAVVAWSGTPVPQYELPQSPINAVLRQCRLRSGHGWHDRGRAVRAARERRTEIIGRPTIVALPVPRPYSDHGTIVNFRIDEFLPEATGAFIEWLIKKSGWTVEENSSTVPISPRHVCILFRRLRNFAADVTWPYVPALEARRLPHVLVGGRSFHEREEIVALRNALTAVEWPDDELRVYATLRGPLFAFSDDALFVYRQTLGADGDLLQNNNFIAS